MADVSVVIGSEADNDLLRRLKAALRRLGARRTFNWWGLAGSQEVTQQKYHVLDGQVIVETETYIGVTLIGEENIVARIQDELDG